MTTTQLTVNSGQKLNGELTQFSRASFQFATLPHSRHVIVLKTTGAITMNWQERSGGIKIKENGVIHRTRGYQIVLFTTLLEGEAQVSLEARAKAVFELYVIAVPTGIPPELKGQLIFPLRNKRLTTQKFGVFGAPWGNEKQYPFFNGTKEEPAKYLDYFHLGTDFRAQPGDPVHAVAPGMVVRVGESGGQWGYYVVIEHEVNGFLFTTVYEHLQDAGRPNLGEVVDVGQQVGQIFEMKEPGEMTHLHLCMHPGPHRPDNTMGIKSNSGAAHFTRLSGGFFDAGNAGLYKRPKKK